VSLGVGRYKWWERAQAHEGRQRALAGMPRWADPIRVTSGDAGSQEGVIVTSHISWECGCAYMYKCTIYDTTRFKAVMTMNLSELRS
jgi:hypothetical protein